MWKLLHHFNYNIHMNGYKNYIVIIYSSLMFIYFIEHWWMLNMALVLLLCVHHSTKQVKPFEHSLTPPPPAFYLLCYVVTVVHKIIPVIVIWLLWKLFFNICLCHFRLVIACYYNVIVAKIYWRRVDIRTFLSLLFFQLKLWFSLILSSDIIYV